MIRKALVALVFLLTVGCTASMKDSLFIPDHRAQPNYLDRLFTGDRPDNPDEAQEWLDGVTHQVRMMTIPIRVYCDSKKLDTGRYPSSCVKAQSEYDKLKEIRGVAQSGIDVWRASGGDGSIASTEAFYTLLSRVSPEATLLLGVLQSWRGDFSEQPIIGRETLPILDSSVSTEWDIVASPIPDP